MNNSQLIKDYTEIAIAEEGLHDDFIANELRKRGYNGEHVAEAIQLIPIAFARQFLNGMGIDFSEQYWILSPNGSIEKQGLLTENSLYSEALKLAPGFMAKPVIECIVFRSSEAHAINGAMNNGSKAENLKLAPICLFNGKPTELGISKAESEIQNFLKASSSKKHQKPWWKLW